MPSGKFWPRNTKSAKLNAGQVMEIRARYRKGGITQGQLCQEYGVSVVQIGRILRGEVWQNVPDPVTEEDLNASAARLMEVQKGLSRDRMAEDIAKAREKEHAGDKMTDELTGEPNAGSTSSNA